MKVLLRLFVVSALVASGSALAAEGVNDPGSTGCGLGWQVTQKKSFLATTTRETTHAFVSPSFGMTSGTSGCDQHSFAKRDVKALEYAVTNADPLMIEMAQGQGEWLEGFSAVMGCSNQAAFGQTLRANYGKILDAASSVQGRERGIVIYDQALALGCGA